jgi:cytochrome c oxidase subunit 2
MENFKLIPEQGSTLAAQVDFLFYLLVGLSIFFTVLIAAIIVIMSIRYRQGTKVSRTLRSPDNLALELSWTIIPTIMALVVFGMTAYVFFTFQRAPKDAMEIFVTGKQWMWKIQHPNGRREINELHIPINTPIRLTMTSEDVIHSFFIPAFRVKRDVVPGRYTSLWFEANKMPESGAYHLFCAEYCGTEHSKMIGRVVVMQPEEYARWLDEGNSGEITLAHTGEKLFNQKGCVTCHREGSGARGPQLAGLFGKEVELSDGGRVRADEEYIRESILYPRKAIVAGYPALMPTFKNQLTEEDLFELIGYIKSLEATNEGQAK